jgi:nitrite reductase/ring-hydroxylating ferredoxin subunit
MEGFLDVASVNDVPVNRAKSLKPGQRAIALYHARKGFFASNHQRPHRGGSLGEGDIIL